MPILINRLRYLKKNCGLVGIKGGTEVEAMNFDEIKVMKQLSIDIVPMTVKIGGPEAINDINYMLSIGIDRILAPMIETPYSLKNFIKTMEALDPKQVAERVINLETIYGYLNMAEIFESDNFATIKQVTIGRSDLSSSIELNVDCQRITTISADIVEKATAKNKLTSVGGQISSSNVNLIKNEIKPNFINSRHMVFKATSDKLIEDSIEALNWEREFYTYLHDLFPKRSSFYNERITSIKKRIGIGIKELATI